MLSNQIQAVAIDRHGNAWIGTDAGLSVRKHGSIWQYGEWVNYVRGNSRLTSNDIRSVCFDPFGYVWIGTAGGGANRLEAERGTWASFSPGNSGLISSTVDVVACADNGDVWFGTPRGLSRRSADGSWSTYQSGAVAGRQIQAIAIARDGQVWFGTRGGGAVRLSLQEEWSVYTGQNSGLASNDVRTIAFDPVGNVWFGTWGGGVSKLSPGGAWTTYNLNNSDLVSLYIEALASDVAGAVWIGTWNGINRLASDGRWATYTTRNSGLANDQVETIGFDLDGNVWFGTRGGGISVLVGGVNLLTPTPANTPTATATRTPTATSTVTRTPTPTATPTGIPVPDLSASTKSVDRAYAMPGDILEYTITVTNTSAYDARGVEVRDTLPLGLDYVAGSLQATGGNAEWSPSNQLIHWTGTVPGHGAVRIRFRAQAHQNMAAGSGLRNTAIIDDGYHPPFTRTATTRVGPFRTYLPLLARNYTDVSLKPCDGGFENGRLEPCWQYGGELASSVVNRLDTGEPAFAGRYSALLGQPELGSGSGGNIPAGSAWVQQYIQVPNTSQPRLTFRYRVISYDASVGRDDRLWDTFDAFIGEELVFCDDRGEARPPGSQGGRHDTGWQQGEVDLSRWRGQGAVLHFAVSNREYDGNGIDYYNTWGFIDDVSVQP